MNLSLIRTTKNEHATLGKLLIDGVFECYTLEDKDREVSGIPVAQWKVQNQTCIPRGTYEVTIDFSTRFKRVMPHILDVPGFDGIRIHWGNTDVDTDGCVLLGQTIGGPDFIGSSRAAFDTFFPKLQAGMEEGSVYITISDDTSDQRA